MSTIRNRSGNIGEIMSQFWNQKLPIILTLLIIFTVSAALSSSPFLLQLYEFAKGDVEKRELYFSGVFSFNVFILLGIIAAIKIFAFHRVIGWYRFFAVFVCLGLILGAIYVFIILFFMISNPEFVPELKTSHVVFAFLSVFFSAFFLDALGQSYS